MRGKIAGMLNLDLIRARLQLHAPPETPTDGKYRHAAVAVILHENAAGTEILFIQRAERHGDPWSGHMAFPGGHADASDHSLIHTAVRETIEEIGLDLSRHAVSIGRIEHQETPPGVRPTAMAITPYVFHLHHKPSELSLSDEVADVVWTPLHPLLRGESHQRLPRQGRNGYGDFPGYALNPKHFVWGMTYRMLHTFFTVIDPQWQPPQ